MGNVPMNHQEENKVILSKPTYERSPNNAGILLEIGSVTTLFIDRKRLRSLRKIFEGGQ